MNILNNYITITYITNDVFIYMITYMRIGTSVNRQYMLIYYHCTSRNLTRAP